MHSHGIIGWLSRINPRAGPVKRPDTTHPIGKMRLLYLEYTILQSDLQEKNKKLFCFFVTFSPPIRLIEQKEKELFYLTIYQSDTQADEWRC